MHRSDRGLCADRVGLVDLSAALERLVARLPAPDIEARVRLWVDRSFTMRGFGTVLTGTLGAGRIAVGDPLELADETVVVRGLESLGRRAPASSAVSRAALNLRAVPREQVQRGQALVTPGAWRWTDSIDVRLTATTPPKLSRQLVLHIGSAAVPVTLRSLGPQHLRLGLRVPLPLQIGDRALLRDPGLRRVVTGVVVLDPAPPPLAERGAAQRRATLLSGVSDQPDLHGEVDRRQVVRGNSSRSSAFPRSRCRPESSSRTVGLSPRHDGRSGGGSSNDWSSTTPRRDDRLLKNGIGQAEAVLELSLPDPELLAPLVGGIEELELADGQLRDRRRGRVLDHALLLALQPTLERLAESPFEAPSAEELVTAGLHARQLAAAAAAGVVMVLPGGVVVAPEAPARASEILARLPQPFTASEARTALATSRKVAIPLLEHLDRVGLTRRVDKAHREITPDAGSGDSSASGCSLRCAVGAG